MITQFDFFRTKYGEELLVDLLDLENLQTYMMASPVQRLSYYDITLVSSGNGKFCIDNFEQDIRPGMVFFSSPGQIRKWVVPEVPKGIVLIFEAEFLCSFFKDAKFVENLSFFHSGNPPVLRLTSGDYHQLRTLFQDIQKEIISFRSNDKHLLRALLYQVLILLDRKFVAEYHESNNKKTVNKYVDGFAQLVESNHHQHRSVEYYAERLHITSGHLNSLLKASFGISAKRYILNRSMLEAKRMLQYSDISIDEIASRLNYDTTSYFIRAFKEHTHVTPLHFRKQVNP